MKTTTSSNQKLIIQPLCEETSLESFSLWLWLRELGCSILAKIRLLNLQFVRAVREVAAGLSALLLSIQGRSNRRIVVGLSLMGVVAPLSACFYMLFDWRVDKVPGWYHDNYFHFFLALAPYLFVLVCLVGVWFLFPYRSSRAYGLIVPAGFTSGKILWLIQCTSNQDFYAVVPLSFIFIGALISLFIFIAFDWLVHNVFHREHAFERRLGTLYNGAKVLPGEVFKEQYQKFYEEKQSFQKQF